MRGENYREAGERANCMCTYTHMHTDIYVYTHARSLFSLIAGLSPSWPGTAYIKAVPTSLPQRLGLHTAEVSPRELPAANHTHHSSTSHPAFTTGCQAHPWGVRQVGVAPAWDCHSLEQRLICQLIQFGGSC